MGELLVRRAVAANGSSRRVGHRSATERREPALDAPTRRELGLAADYSTVPNFWWVLRAIVGRSVVTTENLRRPPQRFYSFEETESGLAVDAGDLPLELYRRKNGLPYQRGLYTKLQERFRTLTGQRFDLYSSVGGSQGDGGGQLEVGLQVESRAGWLPIEQAGAGLWEALVTLSATVSEPGQVVFLDEAATHLHSSWQLQLLRLLGTEIRRCW